MKSILWMLCMASTFTLTAQNPEGWTQLNAPAEVLRSNALAQEQVLDLVEVSMADSMLTSKRQYHRVPIVSWFIRMAGYNWRRVDPVRQKFVGTANRGFSSASREEYTEADVNTNLVPHLQKYLDVVVRARQKQITYGRGRRKKDLSKPPFIAPTEATRNQYDLHCELTPPFHYRESLNQLFYPCLDGSNFKNHPNFGYDHPALGMYGSLVSDCNHSCHPELHPYESLWWLDLHPARDGSPERIWNFAFVREGSARFKNWSKAPKTARISVPFAFSKNRKEKKIYVQHLIMSEFHPNAIKRLAHPDVAQKFDFTTDRKIRLIAEMPDSEISLSQSMSLRTEGLQWWIDRVVYDLPSDEIRGYFNVIASVRDVYAAKVIFR